MKNGLKQKHLQAHVLSQQAYLTIQLMQMNSTQLQAYLQEAYESNPVLERTVPRYKQDAIFQAAPAEDAAARMVQPVRFKDALLEQLNQQCSGAQLRRDARLIIENLDEDGLLRCNLNMFGIEPGRMRAALREVQSLDPPGVGARSVAECLRLQLERIGTFDERLLASIETELENIANDNFKGIARHTGTSEEEVRRFVAVLRTLSPKPAVAGGQIRYIVPDLYILPDETGGLRIRYREDCLPGLCINAQYMNSEDSFVREQLEQARKLIASLDARKRIFHNLVDFCAVRQRDFFLTGAPLKPLAPAEAAKEFDVHLSSVYRIASGKYLACQAGTISLAQLFQRNVHGKSPQEIQLRIHQIKQEFPEYSDEKIAQVLKEEGICIARRTVAKYRNAVNGPRKSSR